MSKKLTYKGLVKLNLYASALHTLQAFLIIFLSDPSKGNFEVSTSFLTLGNGSANGQPNLVSASEQLFEVNLAYLVAIFFALSAIAHLFVATVYRKKYVKDLKLGMNKVRWYEYALSASTMMVGIALLSGIYDLSSLLMIFGLTAIMNLTGLAMEIYNQGQSKPRWLAYNIGVLAGAIPWLVIGLYFWGTNSFGTGGIPTFVYGIYLSIFVFFNCFAVNMLLQYKQVGKWRDYLYGERTYIILSFIAKSALAWQVFVGALRP